MPLALAGWLRFCLVLEALALDLTVGVAIGRAKLIGGRLLSAYQDGHGGR